MAQPNPNNTKVEQQRYEAAEASLKNQTESNYTKDTEAAADGIADNAEDSKKEK
jgi:predicted S18 family serine protease